MHRRGSSTSGVRPRVLALGVRGNKWGGLGLDTQGYRRNQGIMGVNRRGQQVSRWMASNNLVSQPCTT